MVKRKKKEKIKEIRRREKKPSKFVLPEETKRLMWGITLLLGAIIVALSFFGLAGGGGRIFMKAASGSLGKAVFALPLLLLLGGIAFFSLKHKNKWPIVLAILLAILGISGIFGTFGQEKVAAAQIRQGGWAGYLIAWPFLRVFGKLVAQIIFVALTVTGAVIFWQFLYKSEPKDGSFASAPSKDIAGRQGKPSVIKKIFGPKFKVRPIESFSQTATAPAIQPLIVPSGIDLKTKPLESRVLKDYNLPTADLLESDKGVPAAGDIRINSAIIKRTLQNFDIPVEMSEVNIGPTVTQYTLKPAEGVKLSKITTLSPDLSLALAAHPIRIEAPIPGRPLVGVEIPNRTRTVVRLRNLIEHVSFQNAVSSLTLSLGRDVAANPVFADLGRMPHLLVAGSTGTGKTICLNSIILSLLYQNSPETLRLILIDPKRVEFHLYNDLPHLLTPVIQDAQKSVSVLKWLVSEMERRFEVLAAAHARDILSYNEIMQRDDKEPLPYIVLVVDELADLMAARGREIEGGIVRLAQMARAVGIHLIVATQRPSVEVITGLIKANITSRITFQVASQVDSRTVLDMAGAEKLLGSGDMLFVSAEVAKARRIQGAYVSDKEVKKVVKYIKDQAEPEAATLDLNQELEKTMAESGDFDFMGGGGDDPLFNEAKRVVIEAKKASASLLQRRLRVGYARAARLIDMLEEKGIVGPGEGAKPRDILISTETAVFAPTAEIPEEASQESGGETDESWKKV
ncbi:MAG: DNA translocase FtsK 4TM domain-containing protein [Candidatus Nealsonbacteria bacterium]|nr:DNA translocase FtsK 4TM domain-containing protein [Candidatus Nealsonbacteria bacterium]